MAISSVLGSSALLPAGLGFRNLLINGNMEIWQRSTSVAIATLGYTADRWYHQSYNGAVISQQPTSDSTRLPSTRYCARVLRNLNATAVNFMYFTQSMETSQSINLAGQTATLSFWARAGAGITSSTFTASVIYGTGTDQNVIAGYTGQTTAFTNNVTLTTTWQKFTSTGAVPTTATEVAFVCGYTPVGTAPANDYFEITNVQLEQNYQPTPFEQRPIGVELQLCQRYYFRIVATSAYGTLADGAAGDTTNGYFYTTAPATMRVRPTSVESNNIILGDIQNVWLCNAAVLDIAVSNAHRPSVFITATTAGQLVAAKRYFVLGYNNAAAYLAFSAEL